MGAIATYPTPSRSKVWRCCPASCGANEPLTSTSRSCALSYVSGGSWLAIGTWRSGWTSWRGNTTRSSRSSSSWWTNSASQRSHHLVVRLAFQQIAKRYDKREERSPPSPRGDDRLEGALPGVEDGGIEMKQQRLPGRR